MKQVVAALALCAGLMANPAAARALVDCPMRDAPFSAASPLIDILLSTRASAALERVAPNLIRRLPAQFIGAKPPTLAAILTVREAAEFPGEAVPDLKVIDRALRSVSVTRADRIARCARYDVVPLVLAPPPGRPRILLFEKVTGFRDGPSIEAAHAAFAAMAARKGWALVTTDKGSAFTPANLDRFDAVIWNNVSGDVLTLSQRAAFRRWMEKGGGYVGVHGSGGDPAYFWPWYADTLLGARFSSHPMNPQFQTARVQIDDAGHPVARGLPPTWDANDEWYSFKSNPRASGSRIIATLDEGSYRPQGMGGRNLRMGDHPIVWSRCIGPQRNGGRMVYSAIGHRPERYADEVYIQMLEQAVTWVSARSSDDCRRSNR